MAPFLHFKGRSVSAKAGVATIDTPTELPNGDSKQTSKVRPIEQEQEHLQEAIASLDDLFDSVSLIESEYDPFPSATLEFAHLVPLPLQPKRKLVHLSDLINELRIGSHTPSPSLYSPDDYGTEEQHEEMSLPYTQYSAANPPPRPPRSPDVTYLLPRSISAVQVPCTASSSSSESDQRSQETRSSSSTNTSGAYKLSEDVERFKWICERHGFDFHPPAPVPAIDADKMPDTGVDTWTWV